MILLSHVVPAWIGRSRIPRPLEVFRLGSTLVVCGVPFEVLGSCTDILWAGALQQGSRVAQERGYPADAFALVQKEEGVMELWGPKRTARTAEERNRVVHALGMPVWTERTEEDS